MIGCFGFSAIDQWMKRSEVIENAGPPAMTCSNCGDRVGGDEADAYGRCPECSYTCPVCGEVMRYAGECGQCGWEK